MWFRKKETKRSNSLPIVILRLFLSVIILSIFGLGIYQAFRYFSGVDPLTLSPQSIATSILSSAKPSELINKLFGVEVPSGDGFDNLANQLKQSEDETTILPVSDKPQSSVEPAGEVIIKFAVVADSHTNNQNLAKALRQAKLAGAKFVIGLGDYSEVGTVEQLEEAKKTFVSSGLPYYLTVGDHDLWDDRDKGLSIGNNFGQVFGPSYRSFTDSDIRFILINNADNYEGLDSIQLSSLEDLLSEVKAKNTRNIFVFLHEALYHPSSDQIMGSARKGEDNKPHPEVQRQAKQLIEMFNQAKVSQIYTGDIHAFTSYSEPSTGLRMVTVGALTNDRNSQSPRFIMVDVFQNGGYTINDTEIR